MYTVKRVHTQLEFLFNDLNLSLPSYVNVTTSSKGLK